MSSGRLRLLCLKGDTCLKKQVDKGQYNFVVMRQESRVGRNRQTRGRLAEGMSCSRRSKPDRQDQKETPLSTYRVAVDPQVH